MPAISLLQLEAMQPPLGVGVGVAEPRTGGAHHCQQLPRLCHPADVIQHCLHGAPLAPPHRNCVGQRPPAELQAANVCVGGEVVLPKQAALAVCATARVEAASEGCNRWADREEAQLGFARVGMLRSDRGSPGYHRHSGRELCARTMSGFVYLVSRAPFCEPSAPTSSRPSRPELVPGEWAASRSGSLGAGSMTSTQVFFHHQSSDQADARCRQDCLQSFV